MYSEAQKNAGYKVDTTRGKNISDVSVRWSQYGDHEKHPSLTSLLLAEEGLDKVSRDKLIRTEADLARTKFIALQDGQLALQTSDGELVQFTNWGFNQMCRQIGGHPSSFMMLKPNTVAQAMSDCLENYVRRQRLSGYGEEETFKGIKLLVADQQSTGTILRASTSPTYGRIYNADILRELIGIIGDGTGARGHDSFKIPGMMDWGTSQMRPWMQGTRSDSTIFRAEDGREMFIFLCQDANPIEAGKLPDGSPDYYFRGFILYNSDVGAGTFKVMWFYLRGVCANRNLWGVEQINSLTIKHTKNARTRYLSGFEPALDAAMGADCMDFIQAVRNAKTYQIAKTDEEAVKFLRDPKHLGLTAKDAKAAVELCLKEEGYPMRTVYDAVQGVTALARSIGDQSKRLVYDASAAKLLKKAA